MSEIRVTGGGGTPQDDDTLTRPAAGHALPGDTDVVRTTPETMHPRPGEMRLDPHPAVAPPPPAALDDPDQARAAIERTRSRMSETIDTIEEVLLRKKEEIQDKLDVLAPIREKPLPIAAGVFGVGLLLGLLTGGDDDDDLEYDGPEGSSAAALAAERRWRSRHSSLRARHSELEDVVAQQRKELKRMRRELDHSRRALRSSPGYGASYAYGATYDYDAATEDDGGTMDALGDAVSSLKETVLGGIADLVTDAFGHLGRGPDNEQDRVVNPT